jgi:hypothetical protein
MPAVFAFLKECGMHSTSFLRFIAVEKLVVFLDNTFSHCFSAICRAVERIEDGDGVEVEICWM